MTLPTHTPRMILPLSPTKRAAVLGEFRFETHQYMTTLPEAKSLTNSQFLSGRLAAHSFGQSAGSLNWATDISAGTFFSLKQSYYSVQEVYASMPISSTVYVSVGRKKYDWTEIDRIWAFGLWQPKYAIDALRPEEQGLTGAFAEYKNAGIQVLAFASSVFIPTIGPEIREEDGQIKADNRWYRPPSQQAGNFDISYKINQGDLWKLVSQNSFAGKVRLGQPEQGPWVSVAAGRKPINDLMLQRSIVINTNASTRANVVVSPKVGHHSVISADAGYRFENVQTSVSYFEDKPESLRPDGEDLALQNYNPLRVYAAQVEWNVKELLGRPLSFQLAYVKTAGDVIQDIEYDGKVSDITMFSSRYRFSDAALGRVIGPLMSIYGRQLITKLGYIYDFDQRGSILGLEFQYKWNHKWSFLLGADILGSDDSNSTSEGFINTYRANDRAYAGASYVF